VREAPLTADQQRTFALLTELTIGAPAARRIARRNDFWTVLGHVFAWRHECARGKPLGPGAIVNRIDSGWKTDDLSDADRTSELYRRHVSPEEEAARRAAEELRRWPGTRPGLPGPDAMAVSERHALAVGQPDMPPPSEAEQLLVALRGTLTDRRIAQHLHDCTAIALEAGALRLAVPNAAEAEWLSVRLDRHIAPVLARLAGRTLAIRYEVAP
jgi:hypothetical protein